MPKDSLWDAGVDVKTALKTSLFLALIFVASLHVVLGHQFARAVMVQSTIVVPDDYASIQAAIDNAEEGSTILVRSGKYVEQLRIGKPLVINGSGDCTVIESYSGSSTIEIPKGVNGVTLANLYVNSSGGTSTGIYVRSQYNTIVNNTVANHGDFGICIYDSSGNTLRGNRMMNNRLNLKIWGLSLEHFLHDIDSTNYVDGKRVYYLVNQTNKTVPIDAGYVAVVNSTGITIRNVNLTHNYSGILLAYTNNSTITDSTCTANWEGIRLVLSNGNTISNNALRANDWIGISFVASSHNNIIGNDARFSLNGIYFSYSELYPIRSDDNIVGQNILAQNLFGFYSDHSSFNRIIDNDFASNAIALALDQSNQNSVTQNNVSDNSQCGIRVINSVNNVLYHNTFVNNIVHANVVDQYPTPASANKWDNDYPSGGNYWEGYGTVDMNKGPDQNSTGRDGISDDAYTINLHNYDRFPLMARLNSKDAGDWNGKHFVVDIETNSTVSGFTFDPFAAKPLVRFNVTGSNDTDGFCRVTLPKDLLWTKNLWSISTDMQSLDYTEAEDINSTYLYFTYDHKNTSIVIQGTDAIPEYSIYGMLFLSAAALFALALALWRKRMGLRKEK